jgi:hypothetical protein
VSTEIKTTEVKACPSVLQNGTKTTSANASRVNAFLPSGTSRAEIHLIADGPLFFLECTVTAFHSKLQSWVSELQG